MKNKKIYLILLVLLIGGVLLSFSHFHNGDNEVIEEKIEEKIDESIETTNMLFIDIKGAVKNPGVYKLNEGTVVEDAIKISGGLLENANTEMINLSKKLFDEMVIIIYTNEEINEMKTGPSSVKIVEKECICPIIENNACIENDNKYTNSSTINNQNDSNKISLNTATKEELMTLNGIGESKANAIIEYRNNNGLFTKIEDITNVSGIGSAVYEKIKDRLTL